MAAQVGTLRLQAHTHVPRHQAVPAANDALTAAGMLLEAMQEFSNRMTTYRFEIDREQIPGLVQRLADAGFTFEGDEPLAPLPHLAVDEDGFLRATLQLTFPGEDGNRKVPNPDLG